MKKIVASTLIALALAASVSAPASAASFAEKFFTQLERNGS